MAERVQDDMIPAVAALRHNRKYPWEEWLDGSTWRLVRGEDFDSKTFHVQAYTAAKIRGKRALIKRDGADVLYVRAEPRDA